jgi:hypothetical protein
MVYRRLGKFLSPPRLVAFLSLLRLLLAPCIVKLKCRDEGNATIVLPSYGKAVVSWSHKGMGHLYDTRTFCEKRQFTNDNYDCTNSQSFDAQPLAENKIVGMVESDSRQHIEPSKAGRCNDFGKTKGQKWKIGVTIPCSSTVPVVVRFQ